jgi:hypothetical protein
MLQDIGNFTVEGAIDMCYALFGVRGPASGTKRPLRGNDHPENTRTDGPARIARGRFIRGIADGVSTVLIAAAAMTTIEIGEITYPFIVCAAGIALLVAMRAAAIRAA